MPKNPNSKSVKRGEPMTGAIAFFLAGCVAELYLLIVRRFFINGTGEQVIAWDQYLVVFSWIGLAILVVGALLGILWKSDKKKRIYGWSIAAAGLFFGGSSFLVHWNMGVLTVLTVVVPVIMLLGILWTLYDRECALALTLLCFSIIVLWVCRNHLNSMYYGTYVKIGVVVYVVILAVVALLTKQEKLGHLLPANADPLPVYVACTLSAIALIAALFSTAVAYYAMWTLAIVVFGLAVYYTVKQL